MRIIVLSIATLILCSCSGRILERDSRHVNIDNEEVYAIYTDFVSEASSRGVQFSSFESISIIIEPYPGFENGECKSHTDEKFDLGSMSTIKQTRHHIRLTEGIWNDLGPIHREMLLFHELGHCLIGRTHLEDYGIEFDETVFPISIMHPNLKAITESAYDSNRDHYVYELFGK